MRVAFRTDASDAIGTGHLMRCLTLADALAAHGHTCTFAMRDHEGTPAGLVIDRGHALVRLPNCHCEDDGDLAHSRWLGSSQTQDVRDTLAALGTGWDWIVVDHYALDQRWERPLRAAAARLMVIDDLADRVHDCDLLLDQNLQVRSDRYDGLVPAGALRLVGPAYALLRPGFAALGEGLAPRRMTPDCRALVYFGGIDADGATLTALASFAHADLPFGGIDVVAGPRNPHLPEIRAVAAANPLITLHEGPCDLMRLMQTASIAIGAAGATAWERCCLSLPTILVTIADNQRAGAAALADRPAALWLGDLADVTSAKLGSALATLAQADGLHAALARNGREICDGHGVRRVIAAMTPPHVAIRPATPDDCDPIHGWRNHPDTRRQSHDPDEVRIEDHRTWFARTITDPDRRLFVGEASGEPVGVIRFDRTGPNALVSVYLVPGLQGRNFGASLIDAGCEAIAREWPGLTAIDAEMLDTNRASLAAFTKAGFAPYAMRRRRMVKATDRAAQDRG